MDELGVGSFLDTIIYIYIYIYNVFGLNWLLSSISRILKLYRKNNNKKNNVVLYMY